MAAATLVHDVPGWDALPTMMTSPPALSLGAANAASAISGSVLIPAWEQDAFTYDGTRPSFRVGSSDDYTSNGNANGAGVYPSGNTSFPPWAAETILDSATGRFEVALRGAGAGGGVRILVNNQYVSMFDSFIPPADGNAYLGLVTLPGPGQYRIRLELGPTARFRGLQVGATDSLAAVPKRSQMWMCVGDSFAEPTIQDPTTTTTAIVAANDATIPVVSAASFSAAGQFIAGNTTVTYTGKTATSFTGCTGTPALASGAQVGGAFGGGDGFVQKLGYLLGVDARSAAKGGTGYLNPGTFVKARDRLATDVFPHNPDVIVWALGINDYSLFTAAAIGAEALLCFQAAAAAVPNVKQIVLSPFWRNGFQTYATNLLAAADAIAVSAATVGATYIDVLRLPAPPTGATGGPAPAATTLTAGAAVGANGVSTHARFPLGTYMQIGTDANAEIRKVSGVAGSSDPYTLQFGIAAAGGNLARSHNSGDPVIPVGPGAYTGSGRVGNAAGDGNSDRFNGADGTHPTRLGHLNLAVQIVQRWVALRSVSATTYTRARAAWVDFPDTSTLVRASDLERWDRAIYDLKAAVGQN